MGEHFQIIKLDATDSTNQYLKNLVVTKPLEDYTVVITPNQLKGRGQMGSQWQSEAGKNLTFSFLKKFDALRVEHQFNLNICASLTICEVLGLHGVPNLKVKWPNDIMSGSSKICGILIENMLRGRYVSYSIIGIGLNVNQTSFQNLEKASSLKSLVGKSFDLDDLLHDVMRQLKHHFSEIETKTVTQMLPAYERLLFRKDKPSTFKDNEGAVFMGFIRRIAPNGKLVVELEDSKIREFDLKQVTLLY
ncbi:biotin--[acetyl-CoA-carboxylase] ligase [Muricauda sp. JGD-17]|uniref:Biotin--[acetyl-CoA-carboxylase] ligase n=1 Tax=Flagellimonas ochracea TaxID=2696472 RepID=A0A964WY70_9FLAO|nr:biotin--[acetyl-CoA-carboxylase] ligase [Allomuricauda ochracea]NAY92513.1 biotin--[acetyl-CoA-carboxylase] ligase [Allomuricauda ochracea]